MQLLLKLLTVFGLGIIELWTAILAGFVMGLNPISIGIACGTGAIIGVVIITLLGERVRARFVKRYLGQSQRGRQGLVHRIWNRYGAIGLGLLSPLLIGAPLGAALGLALGVPARRLLMWMIPGIILWTALLTVLGALGLMGIRAL